MTFFVRFSRRFFFVVVAHAYVVSPADMFLRHYCCREVAVKVVVGSTCE